jgi:hypothetical protein
VIFYGVVLFIGREEYLYDSSIGGLDIMSTYLGNIMIGCVIFMVGWSNRFAWLLCIYIFSFYGVFCL